MSQAEIGKAVDAAAECLTELKPLIQEIAPQLVG
jgi:hypothetical protein